MPRRTTEFAVGEYYHVYNRGSRKQRIFFDRENYLFFLRKVRKYIVPDVANITSWCLLPNHYHLLLKLTSADFSKAMHRFSVSYSMALCKQRELSGALFQGRFQAIHVDDEAYLLHLTRYIHWNPVDAGLALRAEDWEFSSYRDYIGQRDGTLAQYEDILREFESRSAYRNFVESRADYNSVQHLLIDDDC